LKILEKTALVVVLFLVLSCLVSIGILVFTDFGTGFMKSNARVGEAARALATLDERFPFSREPGTALSPARVEVFLEVSGSTKPSADRVEAWIAANGPTVVVGRPVFNDEGAELVVAYLGDLSAALSARGMGPAEFEWIHQRLRLVAEGPPSEETRRHAREEAEKVRRFADSPEVDQRQRTKLRRHLEALEDLPDLWGSSYEADWSLYRADEERIRASVHPRRAVRAMGRLLVSAEGGNRVHIEVNPDLEDPASPPVPPDPPSPPPPSR